ncbi:hypothetical protein D3C72_1219460 [compost metagenome]
MAGHRRHQHQSQYRQHHAQRLEHEAEQHHRAEDPEQRLDVPAGHAIGLAFFRHGAERHHGAEQRQHDAEPEREISGAHPGGGAHGVATGDEGKTQADDDEHQARQEVGLFAYAHAGSLKQGATEGANGMAPASGARTIHHVVIYFQASKGYSLEIGQQGSRLRHVNDHHCAETLKTWRRMRAATVRARCCGDEDAGKEEGKCRASLCIQRESARMAL